MFKERWTDLLANWDMIHKDLKLTDPNDFNKLFESFLGKITKDARKMGIDGKDEEHILKHMKHHLGNSPLQNLRRSYSETYNGYQTLADKRRQEAKADMVERIRYLFFRMLTAIGIAAVVMTTYYLAGEWGIQLPMARAVLGAPL
ncbi:MAG: hypothetical protein AB2697_22400 [Candidatus Thiodiazotropha endolucinida]